MHKIHVRPERGNLGDLFAWAERQHRHELPAAARRLARRYRLPPATARTLAELAGIGGST